MFPTLVLIERLQAKQNFCLIKARGRLDSHRARRYAVAAHRLGRKLKAIIAFQEEEE